MSNPTLAPVDVPNILNLEGPNLIWPITVGPVRGCRGPKSWLLHLTPPFPNYYVGCMSDEDARSCDDALIGYGWVPTPNESTEPILLDLLLEAMRQQGIPVLLILDKGADVVEVFHV